MSSSLKRFCFRFQRSSSVCSKNDSPSPQKQDWKTARAVAQIITTSPFAMYQCWTSRSVALNMGSEKSIFFMASSAGLTQIVK